MKRRIFSLIALVGLTTLQLAADQPVNDNTVFELDGNIIVDASPPPPTDWKSVNLSNGPISGAVRTGVLHDPPNGSIFAGGGSKDVNPISQWGQSTGSVPIKDDILNAYAYAKVVNGQLLVFFGADRYDTSGNANFGFWFFKNPISAPNGGSSFAGGGHSDGDVLVVSGYTQGGSIPVVDVYKWVGNPGSLVLQTEFTGNIACHNGAPAQIVCASSNTQSLDIGSATDYTPNWQYTSSSGVPQLIPPNGFVEGGINMTHFFNGTIPCFASFLVETRTSVAVNSTLKDFIIGSFGVCSLSVTKDCGVTSPVTGGIQYSASGKVTNTGLGTLYNVKVTESPTNVTPFDVTPADQTLDPGEETTWATTYTVNAVTSDNTAQAFGTAGQSLQSALFSSATYSVTCRASITYSLGITKSCTTSLAVVGSNVSVKVDFSGVITNNSDVAITGLALTDAPDAAAAITLDSTSLDAKGGTTNYSGYYYPTAIDANSSTNGKGTFTDTIKVTGASSTFGTVPDAGACNETGVKACYTATCAMCESGSCQLALH